MDDGNSFKGAALGTVFVVNGLLAALEAKGIFTKEEIIKMLDATLLTIEKAQTDDFPENAAIWAEARVHVDQIMASHADD